MIQVAAAAFTMGVLGSFHCVGMCGPLALALPLQSDRLFAKFTGTLLYNAGRIIAYSLFGLVAGLFGESMAFIGFQQWLSVALGIAIIAFVIVPRFMPHSHHGPNVVDRFFQKVRTLFGQLFFKKHPSTLFAIGLLNGLLPCGMVYLATAGAAATGHLQSSVLFMAAFGAGTLPVMWGIAFWGNLIGMQLRQKIRAAYPYMMLLMACLLIVRGLGLGIPYISPVAHGEKHVMSCFERP